MERNHFQFVPMLTYSEVSGNMFVSSTSSCRYTWRNGYHPRKWLRLPEFKFYIILSLLYFMLMPLQTAWISSLRSSYEKIVELFCQNKETNLGKGKHRYIELKLHYLMLFDAIRRICIVRIELNFVLMIN